MKKRLAHKSDHLIHQGTWPMVLVECDIPVRHHGSISDSRYVTFYLKYS